MRSGRYDPRQDRIVQALLRIAVVVATAAVVALSVVAVATFVAIAFVVLADIT